MRDIDCVINLGRDAELQVVRKVMKAIYQGKKAFNIHLITVPKTTALDLTGYFNGYLDLNSLQKARSKQGPINEIGIYVDNRSDFKAAWGHLALIFSKRGKVTNAIKIELPMTKEIERLNKDTYIMEKVRVKDGNKTYHRVQYPKKILCILDDKTPAFEAMNKYDRIWILNKVHILGNKKQNRPGIRQACLKCADTDMVWNDILTELECPSCHEKATHPRVLYLGKKMENLDPIREYIKVMGRME